MNIISARNVHRAYLLVEAPMGQDLISDIADFREMTIGSVQARWEDNDAADGKLILQASNVPDEAWFDDMECADVILDDDNSQFGKRKTKLFNLSIIGFRYVRVRYLKGSNTQGKITVFAVGKKNG